MQTPTMKLGNDFFSRDADNGLYPIFSMELNRRVANKEACIISVVGEAGTSKSYTGIQLARNIDKRFNVDQIVFTYSDYCKELGRKYTYGGVERPIYGLPIVFDEPSYAMGKREWYKDINQALVKTIESQRFMVRPLFIPIININLLDKTLRDYLIIFQVYMIGRGRAMVYRTRASQGEDKTYRYLICKLKYPILDSKNCLREKEARELYIKTDGFEDNRNKSSCLDCKDFNNCPLLRAQYERKKRTTQFARYEQDEEKAKMKESKELTDDQLLLKIKEYLDECKEDNIIKARRKSVV